MKRRHVFAITATMMSAFVFSACSPFQRLSDEYAQLKHLDESNYTELDGAYQLYDEDGDFSLLHFLTIGEELSGEAACGYLCAEIEVLDEHTLQCILPHVDREARILQMIGHFSDGCFYFDTIHNFGHVYYVFWGLGDRRRRICLHQSDDIICSSAKGGTMFLVIFPVNGVNRASNFRIKRVDD